MKWKKFMDLKAKHPFLEQDLDWIDEPHQSNLREFVRTKIEFIAFRSFHELDLNMKPVSVSTPIAGSDGQTMTRYYNKTVEYKISFRAEDEADCARRRYVAARFRPDSILDHINEVTAWFEYCDEFHGKQLVWERIVKRTKNGSSHTGITKIKLEIYQFPKFYRSRPVSRLLSSRPELATIAWMAGSKLPQISPETLEFAD